MAIDPNVFYRAGAIKGQLAQQQNQNRQRTMKSLASKVGNYVNAKQDQYDKNMTDFNGEIPREVVPEETMMQLTRHISQEKAVYTANAKIIRSSLSRKKKREAAEENEKIKSGLAKVYADYQGAHDIGKVQEKNLQNVDLKYADQMQKDNSLNFANQEWYKNGIKFSRDGMTINDVKEEQVLDDSGNPLQQSRLVSVDKRLSDFKFAKPVQGLGEDTFSKISTGMSSAGLKQGDAGMSRNEDFLRNEKNKYVKAMKSLSPEEQRQFYFNGLSGEPGTAQADIDAMKQIGMSKADYDVMMDIQDEDAPGYENAMNKREQFEKVKQTLGFRKDFLTPKMIESQWETLTNVYDSGHQEGSRLRDERNSKSNKNSNQTKRGKVIIDGFGQVDYQEAVSTAKKMGTKDNVSYDKRMLIKFVNVGNGMTQKYLRDDYGGYKTKGDLIPTNEALALRGLDNVGISFKTTKPEVDEKLDKLKIEPEFDPTLVELQKKGGYLNEEQKKSKLIDDYQSQYPEDN